MFSPLLALATYLNHVHHVQCACRCSVLAWHWQRTWTGVGYASKRNTADPRRAQKLAVTVLISSQCVASGKNRIIVACMETCCHIMGGQALCESRPRGTAFSHVNVLHCTSNSLVPYGLLPQVKRQHFYFWLQIICRGRSERCMLGDVVGRVASALEFVLAGGQALLFMRYLQVLHGCDRGVVIVVTNNVKINAVTVSTGHQAQGIVGKPIRQLSGGIVHCYRPCWVA